MNLGKGFSRIAFNADFGQVPHRALLGSGDRVTLAVLDLRLYTVKEGIFFIIKILVEPKHLKHV